MLPACGGKILEIMNTIEFYKFAVEAAKNRGYEKPSVTTISGCYNGDVKHSCQLWDNEKHKHINSGLHGNPVAAIQAFKDAIEFHNKTYADYVQAVEP